MRIFKQQDVFLSDSSVTTKIKILRAIAMATVKPSSETEMLQKAEETR